MYSLKKVGDVWNVIHIPCDTWNSVNFFFFSDGTVEELSKSPLCGFFWGDLNKCLFTQDRTPVAGHRSNSMQILPNKPGRLLGITYRTTKEVLLIGTGDSNPTQS